MNNGSCTDNCGQGFFLYLLKFCKPCESGCA